MVYLLILTILCAIFVFQIMRYTRQNKFRPFRVWLPLPVIFSLFAIFIWIGCWLNGGKALDDEFAFRPFLTSFILVIVGLLCWLVWYRFIIKNDAGGSGASSRVVSLRERDVEEWTGHLPNMQEVHNGTPEGFLPPRTTDLQQNQFESTNYPPQAYVQNPRSHSNTTGSSRHSPLSLQAVNSVQGSTLPGSTIYGDVPQPRSLRNQNYLYRSNTSDSHTTQQTNMSGGSRVRRNYSRAAGSVRSNDSNRNEHSNATSRVPSIREARNQGY